MHQGNPRTGMTHKGRVARLVIGLACLIGSCTSALAFPITIDPGAYTGQYSVAGGPLSTGPITIELAAGSYQLGIADTGFRFDVDASGQVSSHTPAAAQGVGSTLRFNTTTISIDPTTYTGFYKVTWVDERPVAGPRNVILLPGVQWYQLAIADTGFRFNVDTQGRPNPSSIPFTVAGQTHTFLLDVWRNQTPVAVISGPTNAQEGETVTLDGSGSRDPEDNPLTYCWTQLAGTAVPLPPCPAPSSVTFTAPEVQRGGETLSFQLVVNDGYQDSSPATADVTITDINHPPIADAGAPLEVREGSQVMLDGSGSYDPDRDPLTFAWDQTTGPSVELHPSSTMAQPTFTAPQVGPEGETLTFVLTVSDGLASASATITVVVENVNHAPLADAGPAQTVNEATVVQLDGSASSDPDSDSLTFTWTQTKGTAVVLSGPQSTTPTFTAPQQPSHGQETLTFRLDVKDGQGGTTSADVEITVLDVDAPPACQLAQASPASLWPPDHGLISVGIVGMTDPDNDQVTLTLTAVTQDEPVQGLGDGDTSPDAVVQGEKVLLRAERSGTGNGRVYQISFTAEDGYGGSCTGTVTVCVPHDRKPGTCTNDGQQYDAMRP